MPLEGERKTQAQRRRRARLKAVRPERCPVIWMAETESQCYRMAGHRGMHKAEVTAEVTWPAPPVKEVTDAG